MNAVQKQTAQNLSNAPYSALNRMQAEIYDYINSAKRKYDYVQEMQWLEWLDILALAQEIKAKRGEI